MLSNHVCDSPYQYSMLTPCSNNNVKNESRNAIEPADPCAENPKKEENVVFNDDLHEDNPLYNNFVGSTSFTASNGSEFSFA
uniref:Uncharacterized protein n=1 Tax=Ditylenchus dipsaci TaxID=166011 RepID=A0A915CUG7_9BILA